MGEYIIKLTATNYQPHTEVETVTASTAKKNTTHTKLADYSRTSYPTNTNTWTVTDTSAEISEFYGLR